MSTYDGFVSGGRPGYHRYSAAPLTTVAHSDALDLTAAVGQRSATWRWELWNGVTGERLGELHPIADNQPPVINHDTSRTIKRELRLQIDQNDLDQIDRLTDRVLPYMDIAGESYQLGRYMFGNDTESERTGGNDGFMSLLDEMNLVDQEIESSFTSTSSCDDAMRQLVDGLLLPRGTDLAASPYQAVGAWRIGSRRGQILNALATVGDLETPWMNNTGIMRAVRVVDPSTSVPDLSFDDGYPVLRDSISLTTDLLSAPNRFVVIGNGTGSIQKSIAASYDLPPSAPHSIANRGFAIQRTADLQVLSQAQAQAAARALALASAPVEQVDLATPPDPRHDGYQVVLWRGERWLEIAWSMTCVEGADMTHTLRRSYVA